MYLIPFCLNTGFLRRLHCLLKCRAGPWLFSTAKATKLLLKNPQPGVLLDFARAIFQLFIF